MITASDEIKQVEMGKPHIVILGAGASYAAFPNGDKNGVKLPLMNNFIETLGLEKLIKDIDFPTASTNFEDIYSHIHNSPELEDIKNIIEEKVYSYFSKLELPVEPTLYDHLVLSLREKDFIATFNWDPFLAFAYYRNRKRHKLPKLLFLHGNVQIGYCEGHMVGRPGSVCSKCSSILEPSRLLYPIGKKNYHKDSFIAGQWGVLENAIKNAFMFTVFGYGAPTSDASAIALLKNAWGSINDRSMEEIEIIDIRNEEDLVNTWKPFIHTHHYQVSDSFYNSWIANHPRRTGEAYINQIIRAEFIENNPLPKDANFPVIWDWYDQLKQYETA